jgi:hypothetical protein
MLILSSLRASETETELFVGTELVACSVRQKGVSVIGEELQVAVVESRY